MPIANDPCYGGIKNYGESNADQLKPLSESDVICPLLDEKTRTQSEDESEEDFLKRSCRWCKVGDECAMTKQDQFSTRIWLHAFEYQVQKQRNHFI